jgi:cell division protease FtsH
VAEKLVLNDISTGASNDIQRASAIARGMVTKYGMSEKLGSVSFDTVNSEIFIGRDFAQTRAYSEQVAAQIDSEVKALIDAAYRSCEEILTANFDKLKVIAEYLLENETMDGALFERFFATGALPEPQKKDSSFDIPAENAPAPKSDEEHKNPQ